MAASPSPAPLPRPAVLIAGAGPAGLMAAEILSGSGVAVTIADRMPSPARKFLIAGRGGLNLTHSEAPERFLTRYEAGGDWLAPMIAACPPAALMAWAEELGEPVFTGSSGRVFPKSFKASPLLRAWLRRLDAAGVRLLTRTAYLGGGTDGARLAGPAGEEVVPADAVLLALGGASWPRLGSDGGWAPILAEAGVPVAPLVPSNAGVAIAWSDWLRSRFAGTPLKRIALTLGGARVRGEAILTRDGLEGGAVYALSGPLRRALASGDATLTLDLRPDLDVAALARRIGRADRKVSTANRLRRAGLAPVAAALMREAAGAALPAEAEGLAALAKAVPLRVSGLSGLERAISSAGGVRREGVDDGLMLKALPGTFVAGEMLDWDAPTGGYLLTATMASGVRAARGILARLGLPEVTPRWLRPAEGWNPRP